MVDESIKAMHGMTKLGDQRMHTVSNVVELWQSPNAILTHICDRETSGIYIVWIHEKLVFILHTAYCISHLAAIAVRCKQPYRRTSVVKPRSADRDQWHLTLWDC